MPIPQEWMLDRKPNIYTQAYQPDNWLLSERIDVSETVETYRHPVGRLRDQNVFDCLVCGKQHGACTGYGDVVFRGATDRSHDKYLLDQDCHAVYHENKTLDRMPGERYEGSSANGACLAARARGWIEEFYWAKDATELALGMKRFRVPALMGSPWWSGMLRTDAMGFIRPVGDEVGGHFYVVCGVLCNPTSRVFVMRQTWGEWGTYVPGFGRPGSEAGFAYIEWDDMETIIAAGSDIAISKLVSP